MVPFDEPRWWYQDDGRRRLLAGWAGRIVATVASRRMARSPQWRAPVPVICIGNFTVGGTGKTPLALMVADLLRAAGERPAFLTRGYGGRTRTARMVDRGLDTAREVGDEALLLAASAPTSVSRDRVAGARLLLAGAEPPSVIILDDGLQNPALAKDLVIAVVDGRRGFGNGRVIPAGPLRAPLMVQLGHVGAIVVNAPALEGGAELIAALPLSDIVRARFPGPVLITAAEPCEPLDWLRSGTWVAYAGIGNPERFFEMLRRHGGDIIHTQAFGDHHAYGELDAAELLDTAGSVRAGLVTTAKDAARLVGASGRCAMLAEASRVVPIRMAMSETDRNRLASLLAGAVSAQRRRPA